MGAALISQLPLVCRSPAIDAVASHERDAEVIAARERRYWPISECWYDHGHVLHEVGPPSLSLVTRLWYAELPEAVVAPRDHKRSRLAWLQATNVGH